MSIAALLTVAWIYATPCLVPHPADMSCRAYRVHIAAEKALIDTQEVDREPQGE